MSQVDKLYAVGLWMAVAGAALWLAGMAVVMWKRRGRARETAGSDMRGRVDRPPS